MRIRDNYRDHRLKIERKMGLIELASKRLFFKKKMHSHAVRRKYFGLVTVNFIT